MADPRGPRLPGPLPSREAPASLYPETAALVPPRYIPGSLHMHARRAPGQSADTPVGGRNPRYQDAMRTSGRGLPILSPVPRRRSVQDAASMGLSRPLNSYSPPKGSPEGGGDRRSG